jgi:hypothetical protein
MSRNGEIARIPERIQSVAKSRQTESAVATLAQEGLSRRLVPPKPSAKAEAHEAKADQTCIIIPEFFYLDSICPCGCAMMQIKEKKNLEKHMPQTPSQPVTVKSAPRSSFAPFLSASALVAADAPCACVPLDSAPVKP